MNKRISWIDIARGIAITLVVFGHLLPNSIVKSMIYCFHMPLFFILSGMLMKKGKVFHVIEDQLKKIYVPYLIWALIFSSYSIKNVFFIMYGTNEALLKVGSNGMLWFLSTLFFSRVLATATLTVCKSKRCIITSIILFVLISAGFGKFHSCLDIGLPIALDIVFLAAAFLLMGNLYITLCDNLAIMQKNNALKIIFGAVFVLTSAVAVCFKTSHGYPQMATLDVGNVIIYFISSILPCVGVILIAKAVEKIAVLSDILIWIGKNTMAIYIFHRAVLDECIDIIYKHTNYLFVPMFIFIMLYCCAATVVINKFCPYLVGKLKNNF